MNPGDEKIGELADKRFGQNFLKDEVVLDEIIQSMPDLKDDWEIVEIGPGLGDLTRRLVEIGSVAAYEVDKRLCEKLGREFSDEIEAGGLELVCGDILQRWRDRYLRSRPYVLVSNLPYYIATKLLLKALKDPRCRSVLVMIQKEVADKFSAKSGERAFSALTVLCQTAGKASICLEVPPSSFVPPPKVDSAVLSIVKHTHLEDEEFEGFLSLAFRQPRKKLLKNLSGRFGVERVKRAFSSLHIMENMRPHEIETSDYHRLYNALVKENSNG